MRLRSRSTSVDDSSRPLAAERPQFQGLGQKAVKQQAPLSLGGGSKQGDLHLDHLVSPGPVKALLNGGALLLGAAGHLLRIFPHEIRHPMHIELNQ